MTVSRTITELKNILSEITQEEFDAKQPIRVLDYQKSKHHALKHKIHGLTQQLNKDLANTPASHLAKQLNETPRISEKIKVLEELADLSMNLPARKSVRVPPQIKEEIEADLNEIHQCINHACYRSAVILCGRILETSLHRKYFEISGVDLLEKAPGTGLGNLVGKLSQKGVAIDPGLMNQIHLINQVRVHSVHKKQQPFSPSPQQAQAILLYTTDVLDKLFNK